MVSIPSANMNGGLKAANSSGTVVGVGVGVAGTVLANAQRVYLTPASSYHLAARQTATVGGVGSGVTATVVSSSNSSSSGGGVIGASSGSIVVGSSGIGVGSGSIGSIGSIGSVSLSNPNAAAAMASTSGAAGTVRYFSQFSKLQPVQQLNASVGQRKLFNGDTMVLVNGSKPLIFATPASSAGNNNNNNNGNSNINNKLRAATTTTAATVAAATTTTTTTVPNGNRVFINKQQLQQKQQQLQQQQQQQQQLHLQQQRQQQQQQQQQPASVIEEDEEEDMEEHVEEEDEHVEEDEDDEDVIEVKHEQQQKPLALLSGTTTTTATATTTAEATSTTTAATTTTAKCTDPDAEPELDIVINNVVCSFSVRCHLKLRDIALNGSNVEYRRENGMVTMKLRRPYTTASIWSSGRITCTGATSESQAKIAARRYARCLNKLGFPTHFQNFRIVNVLGTCSMPWAIKIVNFSERHRDNASYEPELHPGVTYKMREPKATLKIFSTGSITVTAASVNDVESAIQHIYPLVHEFRKQRSAEELQHLRQKQRAQAGEDPNELEDQLVQDAKLAAKDDLFVNTTAAHTNATRPPGSGPSSLASQPINTTRRLDQYKHNNNSSSSGSDNICANARRRATECWASKLQNKRPRYNDPGTATATGSANASGGGTRTAVVAATTTPTATTAASTVNSSAGAAAVRLRSKPLMPVDVVLKQSSSRARNAGTTNATTGTATAAAGTVAAATAQLTSADSMGMCVKRDTFSPSDFAVDDFIEEVDDEDMGMMS
ncbi:hypothetical protein KR222_001248, partial [Zaprionus bogoriensis]